MFKKKTNEKVCDISKQLSSINTKRQKEAPPIHEVAIQQAHIESEPQIMQIKNQRYGLIQKEIPHKQQKQEKTKQSDIIMKMYIKMRMAQLKQNKQTQKTSGFTANQILQMQKQYLSAAQSIVTQYNVKEIQKKLQKLANQTIKSQLQSRNNYIKDLLQNQLQRMEYASKKELKLMKQQRQRLDKQLSSKYASQGRRHYIQNARQSYINDIK